MSGTDATEQTIDEAYARRQLDALRQIFPLLPQPHLHWLPSQEYVPGVWGTTRMVVNLASDTDADAWCAALGAEATTTFDGWDSDREPGVWTVHRSHGVLIRGWLPGVDLKVAHGESRSAR